jgi:O-antigen/teichoic acid export membrane protein
MLRKDKGLENPERNIYGRASKGVFWVFLLRAVQLLLQTVKLMVLAHLLDPYNFGLMGIALLTMAVVETFSTTGFEAALIQKKEDIRSYLDVAWTVLVFRGFVLFTLLYLIAPHAATFFDEPEAAPIIRVVGISVVFKALTNIGVVYFQKEMEFHRTFVHTLSGTLADISVAIPAAFLLRSVWALVFGSLAAAIVRLVVSYVIHPYRPHLSFNNRQFRELFGFGKWLLGSTVVVFLARQGDDAFLGKVLGASALGFYQMAYRFADLPGSEVGVLSRVAFPAYSKLQGDIAKLKTAYLKMVGCVSFLCLPLAGGIFALSPEFTQIFLGDKWMPMVPVLRILIISGMIKVPMDTCGALFNGMGRPDISFRLVLVRVITLAVIIYPLTMRWQITGTALAVVLAIYASVPIWLFGTAKLIKAGLADYLRMLWPPLIGTVGMCLVLFGFGVFIDQSQLAGFLCSVLTGVVSFLGFMFLIQELADYAVLREIKSLFDSLRLRGEPS